MGTLEVGFSSEWAWEMTICDCDPGYDCRGHMNKSIGESRYFTAQENTVRF